MIIFIMNSSADYFLNSSIGNWLEKKIMSKLQQQAYKIKKILHINKND